MLLHDKIIVVTGGTGSLGKVLVRRLLSGELGTPRKIIVLSRDEAKQHEMRVSYLHKKGSTDEIIYRNFLNVLEFRIGDVRSYPDVCSAIRGAHVVVNAAALKQVPTCEYFPEQALLTNCMGAVNLVRAISEHPSDIETVIGVSTDKAVKPVNVMGMTKALQERIFTVANVLNSKTRFVCVRYGNVLASRGSVIPLFHQQIRSGGPLTITHPEMTRFLLSLQRAVDTVFCALKEAKPGETIVPRVPAALMTHVAKALIGGRSIEIQLTGIRPGEKMHEILISEEEARRTVKRGEFYAIAPMLPELNEPGAGEPWALNKEYSSGDDLLGAEQTKELLAQHGLLLEQDPVLDEDGELLR